MNLNLFNLGKKHKFTTSIIILDLIIFILLFPTQGLIWIILSIIFWIVIVITMTTFLIIRSNYLIKRKFENGLIDSPRAESDKRFMAGLIIIMLIIMGSFGYLIYAMFIPNFKGAINEGYLQETVNEITEGKITDRERISAVLEWFDQDKDNLNNWWFLTHSDKPYFQLPGSYIYFLTVEPYICIRCFEDNDPRWLLTSRCGACGEYSRLFMIMAETLGYEVRRVHAEGEDHVWNEIKINGVWVPVDPTNVSYSNGGDGWEHYGFFEWKEGNLSYAWAEYPNNDIIEDLTYLYTNLTNVTIHCVDENNNTISDVTITIMSDNLHDPDRIRATFIKDRPKPKTAEIGSCTFQMGGGTYKFIGSNIKYSGETKWIEFTDNISEQEFFMKMKKK